MNFSKKAGYILILLPFIVVVLATGLNFPPLVDEKAFHLKVVLGLRESWKAILPPQYNITSPPLPHILMFLWGKVFGYSLFSLRFLTMSLSIFGFILFYFLLKRQGSKCPLETTLLLLFFPYAFLNSFTIYTVNYGLGFGLITLWFYLKPNRNLKDLIFGAIFATLACLSRQFYLSYPAAMLIKQLIDIFSKKERLSEKYLELVALITPLLLSLFLFTLWRGFVSPEVAKFHPINFSLSHLVFFVIFLGFYFPVSLSINKNDFESKFDYLFPIFLLPFFFLFKPQYYHGFEVGKGEGIILRLSYVASKIIGRGADTIFLLFFFVLGVFVLAGVFRRIKEIDRFLLFALFFIVVIEAFTPYIWERLWVSSVPLLSLMLFAKAEKRLYFLRVWIIFEMLLAGGYAYLKMGGIL